MNTKALFKTVGIGAVLWIVIVTALLAHRAYGAGVHDKDFKNVWHAPHIAPELDPGVGLTAVVLLVGVLAVIRARRGI